MVALADQIDRSALDAVCRRHRVARLSLFGSVLRGEERSDSDVDLLVEYEHDYVPTYFDLSDLADELSELFGGRRIDIGRPQQLHWYIRDRVLSEAREIYAR